MVLCTFSNPGMSFKSFLTNSAEELLHPCPLFLVSWTKSSYSVCVATQSSQVSDAEVWAPSRSRPYHHFCSGVIERSFCSKSASVLGILDGLASVVDRSRWSR